VATIMNYRHAVRARDDLSVSRVRGARSVRLPTWPKGFDSPGGSAGNVTGHGRLDTSRYDDCQCLCPLSVIDGGIVL